MIVRSSGEKCTHIMLREKNQFTYAVYIYCLQIKVGCDHLIKNFKHISIMVYVSAVSMFQNPHVIECDLHNLGKQEH